MDRYKRFSSGLVVVAILIAAGATTVAQEQISPEEKAKRLKAAMAAIKPSAEHKQLEALTGTWNQDIKVWPQPGAAPVSMKGTCQNRMILGGRFLLSEGKGGQGAMAIESMTIYGFDRRYKKFTIVSYDSMGTYYVTAAGLFNDSEKAMVMYGEDTDPIMGGTQTYNMILRPIGPDKYILEIVFTDPYHTQGKGPFKAVEITHSRVK